MPLRFLDEPGLNKVWNAIKDINPWMPKNAASHNSIYRGKDITAMLVSDSSGESISNSSISNSVSAGTFDDIFVGDYINLPKFELEFEMVVSDPQPVYQWVCTVDTEVSSKYTVVGLDLELNKGDGQYRAAHNLTIMPNSPIGLLPMNFNSNSTTSGYYGASIYTGLQTYEQQFNTYLFSVASELSTSGNTHLLTTSADSTGATGATLYAAAVRIPSIVEILGINHGSDYEVGADISQFPAFEFNPDLLLSDLDNKGFWLRTIKNANEFYRINEYGVLGNRAASENWYIRPVINIIATPEQ